MPGPPDWDATTYDRVSSPQLDWGLEVLERLDLHGDETVLDAGCGTGRVTSELLDRLPRGRVIAVDGSPAMVAKAREALGPRAQVIVADLLELVLEEPVDLIFSTATLHWIDDHRRLFTRFHAALRLGGRLEAQCGGRGNVRPVVEALEELVDAEPYAEHLVGKGVPWHFASGEEAESTLRDAGFTDVRCWLEDRDARPSDLRAFVASSNVCVQLDALPHRLRESFLDDVMARLSGRASLPYVRLNLSARRDG
ncbi:MAG: class I SAM-dependent methyltransferase [Solirubrobacteraceae bacterium]